MATGCCINLFQLFLILSQKARIFIYTTAPLPLGPTNISKRFVFAQQSIDTSFVMNALYMRNGSAVSAAFS